MPADARALDAAPAVEAIGLTRNFSSGGVARGIDGVSLQVARGEVVAVMGPSGSGKSTLLFLLGGLDRPDGGQALLSGVNWESLADDERPRFRRRHCGFIVQGSALLPQATAAENIEVPLLLESTGSKARQDAVTLALERVELTEHALKLPDQLSGGQQQRVAIARALAAKPTVILADEPTANLDSATAQTISKLLVRQASDQGAAAVLVTHDPEVARHADRVVQIHSGRLNGSAA